MKDEMYINKLIKREVTTMVVSVLLIMTIFIGISFSAFLVTDEGQTNTISVGDIEITYCSDTSCNEEYTNYGQVIGTTTVNGVSTPTDIYPYETNALALAQTPYIFNINNTGVFKVFVNAFLDNDTDYIPTGSYASYSSVTDLYSNYIKVGIGECSNGIPDVGKVSIYTYGELVDHNILSNEELEVGADKTYCLWTWLSNDAPNQVQSTYFVANLRFTAEYKPASPKWYNTCSTTSTDIKCKLLTDNTASSDASINFAQISSDSNGKGLMYTSDSTKTEDIDSDGIGERVYYFRGEVENNYLSFGGYCWRIVRTNEDGSVKLKYGGVPNNGTCPQTGTDVSITSARYNSNNNDNAYIGYMYGVTGSASYQATHANTNNSTIKNVVDAWFDGGTTSHNECNGSNCNFNGLTHRLSSDSYLPKIANTTYCNERTISTQDIIWGHTNTKLGYGTNVTNYMAAERYFGTTTTPKTSYTPKLSCENNNDKFSTSSSTKGNKKLRWPIALLTVDELVYAGVTFDTADTTNFMHNGAIYATMSPLGISDTRSAEFIYNSNGKIEVSTTDDSMGVIPVISLKDTAIISSGNGTYNSPYIVN